MRAARLRHRVEVQRATDGIDAFGDQTPTWTSLGTFWAAVEPLNGREYFIAAGTSAESTIRVLMRAQPGKRFSPKDRVLFGDRVLDVNAVVNQDERGVELTLFCVERLERAA